MTTTPPPLGLPNSAYHGTTDRTSPATAPPPHTKEHQPAELLDEPRRADVTPRGCSPTRFRNRMADQQHPASTPAHHHHRQQQQSSGDSTVISTLSASAQQMLNSLSLNVSGANASGGGHFSTATVTDTGRTGGATAISASCPICGSLRLPATDVQAGASISALQRRKDELAREMHRVDKMIASMRRAESQSAQPKPSTPRLRQQHTSGAYASASASPLRTFSASAASGGGAAAAASNGIDPFQLDREASCVVADLKATAESLLGANRAYQMSQSPPPHAAADASVTESILKRYHVENAAVTPGIGIEGGGPKSSSASTASPIPHYGRGTGGPGRHASPATSSVPSLTHSPIRDEMYGEDHSATLKELAMLRAEREMKKSQS